MMSEKRFEKGYDDKGNARFIYDNQTDKMYYLEGAINLLNSLSEENKELKKENEQLKSLYDACRCGQKNLMKEMKLNDEALDKIWDIMKVLYGVVDDEW